MKDAQPKVEHVERRLHPRSAQRWARAILVIVLAAVISCAKQPGQRPGKAKPAELDLAAQEQDSEQSVEPFESTFRAGPVGPTSEQLPIASDDPRWGDPNAPVTIVYFTDFQCPFCSRAHVTVNQLKSNYGPDKLRIITKHNPLPFHQDALPAAMAAQAVYELRGVDAFDRYVESLFASQSALTDENLLAFARAVGVSDRELIRHVREPRLRDKIERDKALAERIGARGTPAFRINGKTLAGAQPYQSFADMIDAELAAVAQLRGAPADQVYPKRVAENFTAPADEGRPEPEPDTAVYKVPVGKSPNHGPATALVTIVEFTDFECPYCRRVQSTLEQLDARYPGKLRFVFKHNPLPFHAGAYGAATLAVEARAQRGDKGFEAAKKALFAASTPMERGDLLAIARELKLNPTRVAAALDKKLHDGVISADQDLASDLEARGTPHFFVNGRRLVGAQPLDQFQALVDEELAKAKAKVAAGTPAIRLYAETIKDGKGPAPPETKSIPKPGKAQPSRGNAWAPVVVTVFSDFQCPFCARLEPTLDELDKAFPGRLRIVWRNLPLPFHTNARPAAAAALEAFAQQGNKGFWAMHKLLFANQRALERTDLESYASQLGLDPTRFQQALDDGRHEAAITADESIAKGAGIQGTPGIVINGYFVSGAQPLTNFKKVVRLALDDLKRGRKVP